jgi:hypothetical protein
MPRNVRNFWLTLTVDGRSSRVEAGPIAKDGGFRLTIQMRDSGDILRAMEVEGRCIDGEIILQAWSKPEKAGELDQHMAVRTKR